MSETTTLKLKKHDNPSTNEEQFDVENYLNGNWDKIDENVGEVNTNISNINSKNTELEKELKEAQEDFYQNSIRGQASGEYIHVEDSSNCRSRIGIGGNHEQKTREGYNLLSASEQYTYTSGNVKLASDGAGKYTMNGDGTAQTETIKYSFELEKEYTIKNNDYLHIMNNGTVTSNAIIILLDSNKSGVVSYDFTTNNKIENLSNYAGKTIKYIQLYMNPIKVDITLTPMIINNVSTAKSFEAYGAMPSPDYPSPVKTVGSNVNIFDLESYYNIVPTVNCTKQLLDNGIRINFKDKADAYIGEAYTTGNIMSENKRAACIKVKPNTIYTLKMSSAPKCYMSFFDKDYKAIKYYKDITSNNYIFTTDNSTEYIYIRLGYQSNTSGLTSYDFTDIKCVEGTEVGEYSKYGQGCVKVTKCNKNLINKNLLTNYQILEDTGKLLFNNTRLITPFIYLKKGTYSLSCNLSRFAYAIYNLDKSFNSFVTWKAFPNQIVLNSDCYIKIEFIINPTGSEQVSIKDITYLQLEKGTTTSYEEHQEQTYIMPTQQPMRSIGDVRDTFIKKNNKWYERHCIKRLILDGTENIVYSPTFNLFYTDIITDRKIDFINLVSNNFLNVYTSIDATAYTNMKNGTFTGSDTNRILFKATNYTTVDNFKAWLSELYNAGTPVYIDYVLKVPVDIECTEEQSRILDELNNARTYKNVTNITTDSKAILSLDYAKDIENLTRYSTEEQVVGTWIDGKTLYRKTITTNVEKNAKNAEINIADINYDVIMINQGKSYNSWDSDSSGCLTWYLSSSDCGHCWITSRKRIRIVNNSSQDRSYVITLEYTKAD